MNEASALVVGSPTSGGTVQIYNPDGTIRFTITKPFADGDTQIRVATADLTHDGVSDVTIGSGPGKQPMVDVYNGETGAKTAGFLAFAKSFKGGVFVASGDLSGDGTSDIIVSQGTGGDAGVRVFSGATDALLASFNAVGAASHSGVRVSVGDVNGDGYADLITSQISKSGHAMITVIDGRDLAAGKVVVDKKISPFGKSYDGGAFIAAGNVTGDAQPEIVVTQDSGKHPLVEVLNASTGARDSSFRGVSSNGARVTTSSFNNDGQYDICVATVEKGQSIVTVYSGLNDSVLDTFKAGLKGSVSIG